MASDRVRGDRWTRDRAARGHAGPRQLPPLSPPGSQPGRAGAAVDLGPYDNRPGADRRGSPGWWVHGEDCRRSGDERGGEGGVPDMGDEPVSDLHLMDMTPEQANELIDNLTFERPGSRDEEAALLASLPPADPDAPMTVVVSLRLPLDLKKRIDSA